MEKTKTAFDQLVKEAIKQIQQTNPSFVSFDGNCDSCNGWDGINSRCECGNRRVYWALSDDESYVYPCVD
jgi:hypothetical protein